MSEAEKKPGPLLDMGAIERRKHPRTQKYGPQCLVIISGKGPEERRSEGVLWDFSEGGVGMDLPAALNIDEIVRIEGDLHSPDFSMSMSATARVAYCRRIDRDRYRVGFGFLDVSYRRLEKKPN